MRFSKRNNIVVVLLATFAVGCAILATRSSAKASATAEPAGAGYHKPTGPELSLTSAASAAIKAVREGVAAGNIILRVAHGSFAQARATLNGQEAVSGPTSSGTASCFPGLSCTAAEVQQHETEERELDESTAYIVEMRGTAFSPPSSRLRKDETASSSEVETVVIDAHTGILEERTIGDNRPDLESLGPVTELTAVVPSESAAATVVRASHPPRRSSGTIIGRVTGLSGRRVAISLSETRGRIVLRTRTNSKGRFEIADVTLGRYHVGVGRPRCQGKTIVVRAEKTTKITLACS